MKNPLGIAIALFILTILSSCSNNPLDVDVSGIQTEPVKVLRLEKDVFSVNQANIIQKTEEMSRRYGAFYTLYLNSILNTGGVTDTSYQKQVLSFIYNKDMRDAYKESQKIFSDNDLASIGGELNTCIKRFKYHFPKRKLPVKVVSYISGFNYNIVYADSTIGIGLDMYLGDTSRFYQMLQWPQYKVRTMKKEYVLPDAVRGWLITEFDNKEPVNNLLNHMIFYGKIFYACDALLPHLHDSIKIAYTTPQMKYCKEYEKNLWGFFAEKNRLYENSMKTIQELTAEGPFTGAISKECPPRIAMWVGWQIVRSYMDNNKKITLEALMNEKDAQKILSKSKYRP